MILLMMAAGLFLWTGQAVQAGEELPPDEVFPPTPEPVEHGFYGLTMEETEGEPGEGALWFVSWDSYGFDPKQPVSLRMAMVPVSGLQSEFVLTESAQTADGSMLIPVPDNLMPGYYRLIAEMSQGEEGVTRQIDLRYETNDSFPEPVAQAEITVTDGTATFSWEAAEETEAFQPERYVLVIFDEDLHVVDSYESVSAGCRFGIPDASLDGSNLRYAVIPVSHQTTQSGGEILVTGNYEIYPWTGILAPQVAISFSTSGVTNQSKVTVEVMDLQQPSDEDGEGAEDLESGSGAEDPEGAESEEAQSGSYTVEIQVEGSGGISPGTRRTGNGPGFYEMELPEGRSQIRVLITAENGNSRTFYENFQVDTRIPYIQFARDESQITTTDTSVTVQGTVEAGAEMTVRNLQSRDAGSEPTVTVDEKGKFTLKAALAEGENVVILTAVDAAGNENSGRLLIVRQSAEHPKNWFLIGLVIGTGVFVFLGYLLLFLYKLKNGRLFRKRRR